MGIGASVFLLALGAIFAFALAIDPTPVAGLTIEWDTVGVILMVAGLIGLVWSLMVYSGARRRIDDGHVVAERERVVDRLP